jgi:hypothetical protein
LSLALALSIHNNQQLFKERGRAAQLSTSQWSQG